MARLYPSAVESMLNLQRAMEASRASDWLSRGPSGTGSYPPINVFQQGDDYIAVMELPGIRREDVDIQVQNNRIRIAGRKAVQYEEGASLHRRERLSGKFDRTLAIPFEVDSDRVKAEYRNGVLALRLPRAERDKPKSIAIN